jgi:hypothetical protein
MKDKGIWLIALFGCGAPTSPSTRPIVPAPAPTSTLRKPVDAMFGRPDEAGRFLRVTDLRIADGKRFGWRIKLPCTGPIEFVETMTLPSPGDWSQIEERRKEDPTFLRESTISADGKTMVTHDYAPCVAGWIEHGWTIAKEDPPGDWRVEVAIPGYVPQEWRVRFRGR